MIEPVGTLIKNKLLERKIVLKRFGEHMGLSERNLQYFWKRDDITLRQIIRASEFLDEDLTQHYIPAKWKGKLTVDEIDDSIQFKILVEISGDSEALKMLPALLKQFREEAKQYGLIIG
ncbi:hypothetical protein [Mucilaginibacter sp. UYCu711]|uniref:hypothetical protein n=1 Tax=Mucilaginibacter sp. UYCu711 TaxID=3156339 RepID=UPI003D19C9F1